MRRKKYYSEGDEFIINMEDMWLDDLETLQEALGGENGVNYKPLFDVLDRLIEGGVRGRRIPFSKLSEITEAVIEAFTEVADPEVDGKN